MAAATHDAAPATKVDRMVTCPTAVDVFVEQRRRGRAQQQPQQRQHRAAARIFVWSDSTLSEVAAQLARVLPQCRARGRRVVLALRRAGSARSGDEERADVACGYARTDGASTDDAKTLGQCGFSPGDALCVTVQPWSFSNEKRARALAQNTAPGQHEPQTKRARR